ncbi:ras guanine nucleotide exchange factor domain-containing protein, partial [Mycena galopus ATCC 62051]
LAPTDSPTKIVIDPDGSVRAGTVPALVEHLTTDDREDRTFAKAFLTTFKSFTTVDDLFDLLVQRFLIQLPPKMTQVEYEDWCEFTHDVQGRVLDIFKSMVADDAVLEKDDLSILKRMAAFLLTEEVARIPAAEELLILIERAEKDSNVKMVASSPPLVPESSKKLNLSDIEPLELARQLTILQSRQYQRIRPSHWLRLAQGQRAEDIDNIAVIALWVAECILSEEDSQARARVVEHLISVAHRCLSLNNFSSTVAITGGLNAFPIRRLKQTWEQVQPKHMGLLRACESIPSNGFRTYQHLLKSVIPPCVPFIAGVSLSILRFGFSDTSPAKDGALVDFRKRQQAWELINAMQVPYNLPAIPSIQAYIEDSFNSISDSADLLSQTFRLQLREFEDERMARLLRESGFL